MSGECEECECDKDESIDIWNSLPYELREKITCLIFRQITKGPVSFRKLIYDRLGFQGSSYEALYQAGGMTITNSMFIDYDSTEDNSD